jgi:ribosomal protein L12E/L44/L45/RPP1/RPP2
MKAPGQLRTAEQVAATVGHFKQSIAEMQALLQQLQGLDLDDDSTQEIHKLLAAPAAAPTQRQAAAAAAGIQAAEGSPAGPVDQAHAGSTCSSHSSSALPPVALQQRLQQEVLQSISELHATITGLSLVPSGEW